MMRLVQVATALPPQLTIKIVMLIIMIDDDNGDGGDNDNGDDDDGDHDDCPGCRCPPSPPSTLVTTTSPSSHQLSHR